MLMADHRLQVPTHELAGTGVSTTTAIILIIIIIHQKERNCSVLHYERHGRVHLIIHSALLCTAED
jgi:hypothetical protein